MVFDVAILPAVFDGRLEMGEVRHIWWKPFTNPKRDNDKVSYGEDISQFWVEDRYGC